jgi:hypothetical protein
VDAGSLVDSPAVNASEDRISAVLAGVRGVYVEQQDSQAAGSPFANDVLVVNYNDGFFDFGDNWVCCNKMNVQKDFRYLTVADDEGLQRRLASRTNRSVVNEPVVTLSDLGCTEHLSAGAVSYSSPDYNHITVSKICAVERILGHKLNVFFTDVDICNLVDPFPLFRRDVDVEFSPNTDGVSENSEPNTGLYWIRSSQITLEFLAEVRKTCALNPKYNDQNCAHTVLKSWYAQRRALNIPNAFQDASYYLSLIGFDRKDPKNENVLLVRFLDTALFRTGYFFFAAGRKYVPELQARSKLKYGAVFHANFLIGAKAKQKALHDIQQWWVAGGDPTCIGPSRNHSFILKHWA